MPPPADSKVRNHAERGIRPKGPELRELLSPHPTRDFLAQYWARKPLYVPGSAKKFEGLDFDLAVLENVVRDPKPRDRLQVRFIGADDKVKEMPLALESYSIRDGDLTVCADWINDRLNNLASYCAGIKAGLNLPGSVFMTAYASPEGHGFGTHYDCQPSFILQIEGSKRWRFSARPAVAWPPTPLPSIGVVSEMVDRYPWLRVRFPDEHEERTFLEQVLKPGDVLFLPAGTWHQARAIDCSLALTMSCIPMTAADFVDDLIRGHLSNSVNWRCNVPPTPMGSSPADRLPPAVESFFEARLSELREHVRSLRAEDLYETWTHHVASLDIPVEEGAHTHEVDLTDSFTLTNGFPVRYVERPDDGLLAVYYLDHRINLSQDALPLIQAMLKTRAFTAQDAMRWLGERIEWQNVKLMLQALVQAGLLLKK